MKPYFADDQHGACRRWTVICMMVTSAFMPFAASAEDPSVPTDDIVTLKSRVLLLTDRIEKLEAEKAKQQAQPAAAPPAAVTKGDIPRSFKVPGTNTSIVIGGYIKGQAVYSSRGPLGNPGGADELLLPPTIPLSNAPATAVRKNYWKESAKESRFTFRSSTPSIFGTITTLIDVDFYGTPGSEATTNSNGLRVRHAWGTIGNLGFGQFWSNMANMTVVPETIDFTPQIGIFGGLRLTGIRWTQPTDFGFWSVAAENPESRIASTAGAVSGPDNDKLPGLNGKIHFKLGPGEFEIVAAFQRINTAEAGLGDAPAPQKVLHKSGYGGGFSGFISTFGDYDRLMFGISATRSMGRTQSALFADALLVTAGMGEVTTGELRGINARGGFIAYRHRWLKTLRSTVTCSLVKAHNPAGLTAAGLDTLDKRFWTAHLNLIWSLVPEVDLGIEYLRANRQVESDLSGDLSRFMAAAKYRF